MEIMETLYCGDCLEVMKDMPDNSVDSIVTDPPYGISFMNNKWDYDVPKVEIWIEALRILKPGGHLLCFAGTRTQHRMACNIEDAGFEIKNMIAWVYGGGFPKSLNVSKSIDKIYIKNKQLKLFAEHLKAQRLKLNFSQEDIAKHFLSRTDRTTSCVWNWETCRSVPTKKQFKVLQSLLNLSNDFTDLIERTELKRKVIGKRKVTRYLNDGTTSIDINITKDTTEDAKRWNGFGSGLKPAMEPITLARKPLSESNIASNVLKHGTGALNIDGCRIEIDKNDSNQRPNGSISIKDTTTQSMFGLGGRNPDIDCNTLNMTKGRWPANFIIDGSEEVEALFPDTASNHSNNVSIHHKYNASSYKTRHKDYIDYAGIWGDKGGSASRFFYCAKASKQDRDEGLDEWELQKAGSLPSSLNHNKKDAMLRNNHPTVKPISLMKYLVRLVTPPDGTCIDPFMGSGSTGKACAYEGFKFIGIDLNPEYVQIAKARIEYALNEKIESERQLELF